MTSVMSTSSILDPGKMLKCVLPLCLTLASVVKGFDLSDQGSTVKYYSGASRPVDLEDDLYRIVNLNNECCHLEAHTVKVDADNDGSTDCVVSTTRCTGGCREYSNSSSSVTLLSGIPPYRPLGTVCSGEKYYEARTCCVPSKTYYVAQYCGRTVIYVERAVGCQCGPCQEERGKCFLRNNRREHTFYINPWYSCTTLEEVDIPHCHGNCPGYHSYASGTVKCGNLIYKFNQDRQSCQCCRSTGLKTQEIKLRCQYRSGTGALFTFSRPATLTTIADCECLRCNSKLSTAETAEDAGILRGVELPIIEPADVEAFVAGLE